MSEKKNHNRFKSWALWLSVAALIAWIVKTVSGQDIQAEVNEALNILLPVLVGFGIVNNPTDKSNI